jgi:urate oxidase
MLKYNYCDIAVTNLGAHNMPSIRQQIYAFVTTNANCTTAEVAQHINKNYLYTVKAMHDMKVKANMLLSTKVEGSKMHLWRVSNKAVKFNTGEGVRQASKAKAARQASVKQQIAALEAGLAALKAQVTA